jgi:hypothetical protein
LEFERKYPQQFEAVFGTEASQLRDILHQPLQDQLSFARSLNDPQNHIIEPWLSHFRQLAASDEFKHIQLRYVRKRMDVAVKQARQLGLRSERALALLFDIVTQHGGGWMDSYRCYECDKQTRRARIDQRLTELRQQGQEPTEQQMIMVIADVIVETAAPRWREKVRRRRMTIVEGRGTVHGHKFDLEREYGLTDQPWEKEAEPVAP